MRVFSVDRVLDLNNPLALRRVHRHIHSPLALVDVRRAAGSLRTSTRTEVGDDLPSG